MKRVLLIFPLLALISLSYGQTKSASDYFMFKANAKYTYQALGTDGTNKISEMSYQCISVKNESGGVQGTFYEDTQMGSKNQQIYIAKGNVIQLIYTKGAYSGGNVNPPKTILKLPTGNTKIDWTWGDTTFSAEQIETVKTKTKTYTDCIVITESSAPKYKMGTKKKYYVNGVGLVKIDFLNEDNKIMNMLSFELIKIE